MNFYDDLEQDDNFGLFFSPIIQEKSVTMPTYNAYLTL